MAPWSAIVLTVGLVLSGASYTLVAKLLDEQKSLGQKFNHPLLQAWLMFLGEALCMVIAYRPCRGTHVQRGTSPFLLLPAVGFDVCQSLCKYVALALTPAGSYQMLLGIVIVFSELLSISFLGTPSRWHRWLGICIVTGGLSLVGLSDLTAPGGTAAHDMNASIAAHLLIVMGQLFAAALLVYEMKILREHDMDPCYAVGVQGMFGLLFTSLLFAPAYFLHVPPAFSAAPPHRADDVILAWRQLVERPVIWAMVVGFSLSTCVFNATGVTITKRYSATTRLILITMRTWLVWQISVSILHWQPFSALQFGGFLLSSLGMLVYNGNDVIARLRLCRDRLRRNGTNDSFVAIDEDEDEELLSDHVTDDDAASFVLSLDGD